MGNGSSDRQSCCPTGTRQDVCFTEFYILHDCSANDTNAANNEKGQPGKLCILNSVRKYALYRLIHLFLIQAHCTQRGPAQAHLPPQLHAYGLLSRAVSPRTLKVYWTRTRCPRTTHTFCGEHKQRCTYRCQAQPSYSRCSITRRCKMCSWKS